MGWGWGRGKDPVPWSKGLAEPGGTAESGAKEEMQVLNFLK